MTKSFGDRKTALTVYIDSHVGIAADQTTIVKAWAKAGTLRCRQFELKLSASELFYATPAEEKLCNEPCKK